jgi:serine protease
MAAPHVAGIAALLLSLEPRLTSDEVRSILQSTARPHPTGTYCASTRNCGTGLVDAGAAVLYVLNNRPTVTPLVQADAAGVRPTTQFTLLASLKAPNGRTAPSSGVTWKQTSGPAVNLGSGTGTTLTVTAPSTTGTLGFSVTVVDSGGYTATGTTSVIVNSPPALAPVAPVATKKGQAVSGSVRANDSENDRITYVLVTGPQGLTLDAASGNWSWTPTTPGTYNVTVMPTDPYGNGPQQTFTVTVNDEKAGGGGALPLGLLLLLAPALLRRRPH